MDVESAIKFLHPVRERVIFEAIFRILRPALHGSQASQTQKYSEYTLYERQEFVPAME